MDDHAELADEHEDTADRLERESERVGESTDAARSKLEAARGDSFIPESLGQDDPGHRVPSESDKRAERREQEAEEAEPDSIGEAVDQRLGDLNLGSGGERGESQLDKTDKTPGGGDVDDVTPEGGSGDDED